MAGATVRSQYWLGVREGATFALIVAPFGAVFGVVATEAGLDLLQVMSFTILVIAGASQFAALQLLTENAPTVIVLLTALAVNLRMAMYSAALTPHLGANPTWLRVIVAYFLVDQTYALSAARYEGDRTLSRGQKLRYYFGVVTPIAPSWYAGTLLGALAGQSIPPEFALDFAVPVAFIALIAPGLRTLAHVAAAMVSVALGLALAFMPYSTGLLIAGAAAMITGARVELWDSRRKAMT